MNKYLLGGIVTAAIVAIAPAIGQMPAPAPVAPQAQNQSARQGRMSVQTRAEVAAHVRTMFDRLDSNRDGSITKAEGEAVKANRGERAGKRMERHGGAGGQMADRGAMFDRMDANRDGAISRDEFTKGREMRIERKVVMNGAPGAPDGAMGEHRGMMKKHGMGAGMGGGMGGHMMKMADLNKDGRVSLQEATTSALQHFDMVDTNRDGRITPEERKAMHQKMMQEHGRNAG